MVRLLRTHVGLIGLFLLPFVATAQFGITENPLDQNELSLSFTPITPEPGQEVTVTLENFLVSMQGSSVEWFANGELQTGASNQTEISIIAGAVGEEMLVEAVAVSPTGARRETSGTFVPRYIDIIVEPQTHVPRFFTGRALPSIGSQVNVTALIDGEVQPDLSYTWLLNGDMLRGASSLGRYTTSFEMPRGTNNFLILRVTNANGRAVGERTIFLPNASPFIEFYEVHPLYGVSKNTYDSVFLTGESVSLVAVPYYLDSRVYNVPDIAEWSLGSETFRGENNPYEVSLNRNFGRGALPVSFRVQSLSEALQGAVNSTMINY